MKYARRARSTRRLWSLCAIGAGWLCVSALRPQPTAADDNARAAEPAKSAAKKPLPQRPRTAAADPPAAAGKAVADPPKDDFDHFDVEATGAKPESAESEAVSDEPVEPRKRRGHKASAATSDKAGAPKPSAAVSDKASAAKPSAAVSDKAKKTDREARKAAAKAKRVSGEAGRQPTAEYRRLRDSWHAEVATTVEPATIIDASGRIPLEIAPVNGGDKVVLTPQHDNGGFRDEDLERAARAFCPKEVKNHHAIAPHLLDLVYRAMRHFEAPLVRLVSGYRKDRAGSRHTQGRAIDMVLPGVSNEQLAEYARQFGFVGVGIYPKSGFVHLDVRENSFFWVDMSLPDERSRPQPHLGDLAAEMDQKARERGEVPDAWVPDNDKEDKAAKRSYAKRALRRRTLSDKDKTKAAPAAAPAKAVIAAE